jgi:leader peptidase (prepilin peptidase) / N-methyltransferase
MSGNNDLALLLTVTAAAACTPIDARRGIIPNRITYPTAAALLTLAAARGALAPSLLGLLCVGGTLLMLYALTGRRGLGLGDVKLGACIGLGLGPLAGTIALALAFVAGGTIGAWLLLTRRARAGDALAFGPFLAAGTLAAALVARLADWSGPS